MATTEGTSQENNRSRTGADRLLNLEELYQKMNDPEASPEEIDEAAKMAEEAEGLSTQYGFNDQTVLDSGHIRRSKIEEVLGDEAHEAARSLTGGSVPDPEKGAVQVNTWEITAEGTLRKVKESSGTRYCLLGQYEETTGRLLRPTRLRVVFPPRDGLTEEMRSEIIMTADSPELRRLAECIPAFPGLDAGEKLEMKQRRLIKRMAMMFARTGFASGLRRLTEEGINPQPVEELSRVPVKSEAEVRAAPISRVDNTWFREWVITLIGAREAKRFTGNAGDWHYLGGLVSGGGTKPGRNEPDYRRMPYVAITPRELSPLMELLGMGPFTEADGSPIADGRSPVLMPEWPEEDFHALEFQLRAVTDYGPDQQPTYSKGMAQPIRPSKLEGALELYEQLPQEEKPYYEGAVKIIRTALKRSEPTIILVRDDQMKIGHKRATTSGMALVTGTFLRGTFDADGEGRPRSPYKIIGNPQLSQLLNDEGFELLEEHMRLSAQEIAEKTNSLPGLAELASDTTSRRLEEIEAGLCGYEGGKDMLTDAITGGGIRLHKSDDWIKELKGEEGQMATLGQIKRRLDGAVASHVRRRLLRGLGIEGYAHHHMTVDNDQGLLRYLWPQAGGPDYVQAEKNGEPLKEVITPVADPSSAAHPKPVSGMLGADDDGDLVTGQAAVIDVPDRRESTEAETTRMKVILMWRFPCVDVPVLWAVPARFNTPWDARSEEESRRFERVAKIFGPELRDEDPTGKPTAQIEDRRVTMLHASNAHRLETEGARTEINDESIDLEASELNAWQMVGRKRELNRAGPLTRDLERLGELTATAYEQAEESPNDRARKQNLRVYEDIRDEAREVRTFIELQLIAHKKKVERDIRSADLTWPQIGYNSDQETRMAIPINYPDQVSNIRTLLEENKGEEGTCLEQWEGPTGQGRHAKLIRQIVQEELPQVIEAVKDIKVDREPFLRALEKRVRDYSDSASEEEVQRLQEERKAVRAVCNWYRSVWSEVMDELEELRNQASDVEAAQEKIDERLRETSQALRRAMRIFSKGFTAEGLAYGVYWDWKQKSSSGAGQAQRQNSVSAGVALLAGRMGECLLPPSMDIEPMDSEERHCVVYSTREGGEIPIPSLGETAVCTDVRVRDGRLYVRLESGEEIGLFFDEESEAPDPAIEGAVAEGEIEARLSKIAPSRALFRFVSASA